MTADDDIVAWEAKALLFRYERGLHEPDDDAPPQKGTAPTVVPWDDETPVFLDWSTFWDQDMPEEDWLIDGVLARGRGTAIYASRGEGKSLFSLWCAARIATERTDVHVVYLDYEMSTVDVFDRLTSMGYGAKSDLSRLHYALLPSIHPLDTLEGANDLVAMLEVVPPDRHVVVVIDTTSRAMEGKENDNDTIQAFYRWTGSMLKRRGATWVRIDHAGKDPAKGQRGGSAKGDDVDVVWHLSATDVGIKLTRDKGRMSWVPETVAFTKSTEPTSYLATNLVAPVGTQALAEVLDKLDVPLDASVKAAQNALTEAGEGKRRQVVAAAMKWRRTCAIPVPDDPEPLASELPLEPLQEPDDDYPPDLREPLPGTAGTTPSGQVGSRVPPLKGEPGTSPVPTCPGCGTQLTRQTDISANACPKCRFTKEIPA